MRRAPEQGMQELGRSVLAKQLRRLSRSTRIGDCLEQLA